MKLRGLWWWIDRWRKSTAYTDMTLEEQGAYRNLIDDAALRGGPLPNDEHILAKACGDPRCWRRVRPKVIARFTLASDGWHNETLDEVLRESERRAVKQANYRHRHGNAAGNNTGNGSGNNHRPPDPDPDPDPSKEQKKEQKISAEPSNGSSPPVLTFPTVGPSSAWCLSSEQLAEWQALFPNIHVWTEMQKVSAWLPANPTKRKTAKGMPRFLVAWLTRAVDGANGNGHSSARPPAARQAEQEPAREPWACPHVEDHASHWRCEQATQLGRPRKDEA